eukprot:2612536-Prymnesium_polylepis.1
MTVAGPASKLRRAHADRPSEECCPASRPIDRALPTPPRLRGTFARRRNVVVGRGGSWWVVASSETTRTRGEVERSAEPPCQAVTVGVRRQSPR